MVIDMGTMSGRLAARMVFVKGVPVGEAMLRSGDVGLLTDVNIMAAPFLDDTPGTAVPFASIPGATSLDGIPRDGALVPLLLLIGFTCTFVVSTK